MTGLSGCRLEDWKRCLRHRVTWCAVVRLPVDSLCGNIAREPIPNITDGQRRLFAIRFSALILNPLDLADESLHHLPPQFRMAFLPAKKLETNPDGMPISQKFDGMPQLGIQVMLFNGYGNLYLFESLGLNRLPFSLVLLIEKTPVIAQKADGWIRSLGNFNQIHPEALGQIDGILRRHDTLLISSFIENSDFAGCDSIVYALVRSLRELLTGVIHIGIAVRLVD